jgi:hypothetical protein
MRYPPLVDFEKAKKLVDEYGEDVEKCRLNYVLGLTDDTAPVMQYLEDLQLPQGGFPYRGEPRNPYCLSKTSALMKVMAELNLDETPLVQRTIAFLTTIQYSDGRWNQNPELLKYDLPYWNRPDDEKTQIWHTGALTDHMIRLGYRHHPGVSRAVDFLLRYRNPDGVFQGFRHSTWLAIAVLGALRGPDDPLVNKSLDALNRFRNWDASDLTWALDCLYWGGIPANHDMVDRMLYELESFQESDGRWKSVAEPDDPAVQTLETLIVLKQFNRV